MKKYENPMLQIVGIKKNDIIATSGEGVATGDKLGNMYNSTDVSYAPDRFNWDAGY